MSGYMLCHDGFYVMFGDEPTQEEMYDAFERCKDARIAALHKLIKEGKEVPPDQLERCSNPHAENARGSGETVYFTRRF